ncbi:hypothetical protein CIB84_012806 [Bambusicola thoracicus]|uniref:Uncharacterized protein n=1 Tax=Bambusicola thoracicus TaxID=9083 RepID=A0A2P4SH75_BAMTH|nr:hypothetical protein CIB84_012806 [Bambusicola thoracicus]
MRLGSSLSSATRSLTLLSTHWLPSVYLSIPAQFRTTFTSW